MMGEDSLPTPLTPDSEEEDEDDYGEEEDEDDSDEGLSEDEIYHGEGAYEDCYDENEYEDEPLPQAHQEATETPSQPNETQYITDRGYYGLNAIRREGSLIPPYYVDISTV
jgi:hypothetical protein